MNIVSVDYNPETNAVEVYLSGCTRKCPGCHNSKLFDFTVGTPWKEHLGLLASNHFVERVMVMGGEPLDQDRAELFALLAFLRDHYNDVWLFTGYDVVPESIRAVVHYCKVGPYIEGRDTRYWNFGDGTGVTLASDNQKIIGGGLLLCM